ncbi:MAG: pyridoxal-phosphate dependent enzyme [bacterium]
MTEPTDSGKPVYFENVLAAVGNTPLVRLNRIVGKHDSLLLAKIESFNPGGSVKDRIGRNIVDEAEKSGRLKPGGTIVEATSGNTGVGLALVAAVRGYKLVCAMPDKMSKEKINLLKAYGTRVVVCPTNVAPDSPDSYYEVARRIARETPNAILANQYHNQENPRSHYISTGPEIWRQTAGKITHFVGGIGTGGTMSGTGRYLKEMNPNVKVICADPEGSILKEYFLTKNIGEARPYLIEGIGEDIIPTTVHFQYFDEIRSINDREAIDITRRLSREEGILIGTSGGAAVVAACQVARETSADAVIVVILPDSGERYLSKVHNDAWMQDQGLLSANAVSLREVVARKSASIPRLITADAADTTRIAVAIMEQHNVSQLPIVEGGDLVGAMSEAGVMGAALRDPGLLNRACRDTMEPPFPRAQAEESVQRAIDLFTKGAHAVIVEDARSPVGIVTRFDVLGIAAN